MDELAHLFLTDDVIACKSKHMMGVELAWQSRFNIAKKCQHNERGSGSDNGSKPKPDTYQNADCCRNPNRGGSGQAAHRQAFLDDHFRAKKADAGHDALRHAWRIRPGIVV